VHTSHAPRRTNGLQTRLPAAAVRMKITPKAAPENTQNTLPLGKETSLDE
jgi:hypothetical protein